MHGPGSFNSGSVEDDDSSDFELRRTSQRSDSNSEDHKLKENSMHRSSSLDRQAELAKMQEQKLAAFRHGGSALNKGTASLLMVSSKHFSSSEV